MSSGTPQKPSTASSVFQFKPHTPTHSGSGTPASREQLERIPSPTTNDFLLPPMSPTEQPLTGDTPILSSPQQPPESSSTNSRTLTPLNLPAPLQRVISSNRSSAANSTTATPTNGPSSSNQPPPPQLHLGAYSLGGVTKSPSTKPTSLTNSNAQSPPPSFNPTSSSMASNSLLASVPNDSFTLAPFRSDSGSGGSGGSGAGPYSQSLARNSSAPISTTIPISSFSVGSKSNSLLSEQKSSAPSLSPQPPQHNYAPSPTIARLNVTTGIERDSSDKVPLLSPDDENSDVMPKSSASTYYEQYEATVNKIRTRRAEEAAQKAAQAGKRTPEQTKREIRIVGLLFTAVLIIIAIVVYVLYPRIPIFNVASVDIHSLRLWSDGTAQFSMYTNVNVQNDNFVSTRVEEIDIKISHNTTLLHNSTSHTLPPLKWEARDTNLLTFYHDFSPMDVLSFADLFTELSRTSGQLTLDYALMITTSENFRLRSISVNCATILQFSVIQVPPTTEIVECTCTHAEQTG